jgi:hypothetical protein
MTTRYDRADRSRARMALRCSLSVGARIAELERTVDVLRNLSLPEGRAAFVQLGPAKEQKT